MATGVYERIKRPRLCVVCEGSFLSAVANSRYCESCLTFECLECKKPFLVGGNRYKYGKNRFCSKECRATNYMRAKMLDPMWIRHLSDCGRIGGKSPKPKKTLAQRLSQSKKFMGTNNPNFKHGLSNDSKRHYNNLDYKLWREAVYKRDSWKCRKCGVGGVYITAHHIKSWAKYPVFRFDIDNGLTLCEKCHSKTDNYRGRGRK